MNDTDTKRSITAALSAFSSLHLRQAATGLLNTLGYRSNLTLELSGNGKDDFLEAFNVEGTFRQDKALFDEWSEICLLFQVTKDHLSDQHTLFTNQSLEKVNPLSYLFFAVALRGDSYSRGKLAQITREINKLTKQPALILFKHGGSLTLSVIDRRLHKKDEAKDVLEKVTLIKDINIASPHRAHKEILFDLSLEKLSHAKEITNFQQLHNAWRATLNISELNKKFYKQIAAWYFWAVKSVEFPVALGIKDEKVNSSINIIRLLTRLIFVWFLKEKNLVPDDLFDERKLARLLKSFNGGDAKKSDYYKAILQNLFFATLNTPMVDEKGNSMLVFRPKNSFQGKNPVYGVSGHYRYEDLFIDPSSALLTFKDIPFLNGGLFDCLDYTDVTPRIRIDCFTDNPKDRKLLHVPDRLFFGKEDEIDLSDVYDDKKHKRDKVKGLIHILNDYKFTIAENTPVEEEIALDPELLGRVFENLLAEYNPETGTTARKATGSFYTPREIVNYMVDESLIAYLKTKLEALDLTPGPSPNGEGRDQPPRYMTTDAETWKHLKPLARELRREQTEAEEILWQHVRDKQLGAKFRRQHAIGEFIVDFVCIEHRLVVEVDGEVHKDQKEYDEERTRILESRGFRVIRFWNDEVIKRTEHVLTTIKTALNNPLPFGEGTGVGSINDIESRLRHLVSYSDEPHQFSPEETDALIDAIHTMKVLDPACGSGAFPMGVLLKVVHVLHKLDPENRKWKQKQIDVAEQIPDSSIRQETLESIDEAFSEENNFADYGRKLYLIENCIYGVDIQPIAVQIAKLRFFVSLLVDQHGDASPPSSQGGQREGVPKPNRGVLSLPNLETKFVAANTLLPLDMDVQHVIKPVELYPLEDRLKKIRHDYFSAKSRKEKIQCISEDKRLREEIAGILVKSVGLPKNAADKLANWDPYDQNSNAQFFDPEWMFSLTQGFDITLGNPPYVRADSGSKHLEFRKAIEETDMYETLWEKWDLYVPFIERSFKLLQPNGVTTLIVSDAYCHSKYAEKSQKWFLENSRIIRLDFFSKIKIFDAAVRNVTYLFQRSNGSRNKPQRRVHYPEFGEVTLLITDEQRNLTYRMFFPEDHQEQALTVPTVPLESICYISVGMVVHAHEDIAKGAFELDDVVSETRDDIHTKKFVEGKFLDRWLPIKHKWLEWGTDRAPKQFRRRTFEELYTVTEKLISVDMTAGVDKLRVTYDNQKLFHNHSAWSFVPWHYLSGVRNKSLKKAARYKNEKPPRPDLPRREELEKVSKKFSAKFLAAVMNSSMARNFLRRHRRSNIHLYPDDWKELPIPDIGPEEQVPIIKLVDQILAAKNPSTRSARSGIGTSLRISEPADTRQTDGGQASALEKEIDIIVYKLYGLTYEEVKIVEPAFALSEEEYNRHQT